MEEVLVEISLKEFGLPLKIVLDGKEELVCRQQIGKKAFSSVQIELKGNLKF